MDAKRMFGNELPKVKDDLDAISVMLKKHGFDDFERMVAAATSNQIKENFKKRYRVESELDCADLGTLLGAPDDEYIVLPALNDHIEVWTAGGVPVLYISQPYETAVDMGGIQAVYHFCKAHGLVVDIDLRYDYYFPGRVVPIIVLTKEHAEFLEKS